MEEKAMPMLVQPHRPTPHEVIPFTHGSTMAGLNTLMDTHVLIFKPAKELGGARPADIIRSGLAQVLVPYYPLAGRIVENEVGWEVQCDGQGAVFIVTAAPDVEEIIVHRPSPMIDEKPFHTETIVLPPPDTKVDAPPPSRPPPPSTTPTLIVKVTELENEGFVLTIKLCKGVCDSSGMIHFLSGWAEMARGKPQVSVLPLWGDKKMHSLPLPSPLGVLGGLDGLNTGRTKYKNSPHTPYSSVVNAPYLIDDIGSKHSDSEFGAFDKKSNPIDNTTKQQFDLPSNALGNVDKNTRYQIHVPNLEKSMQTNEYYAQDPEMLSCRHHSKVYRQAPTEPINVHIPFSTIKILVDWVRIKDNCPCEVSQVLAAHLWRSRTQALHVSDTAEARLFFITKSDENLPIGYYGSFAFNCQVKARSSDLVNLPLSYTVQLIQEAEANLLTNFSDCINDFKHVHCACGYTPLEVLMFTNLPNTDIDEHLDFGVLGKPLPPATDTIHFPSQVNIAALAPASHSFDSILHVIINNIPFIHVNEFRSLLSNVPVYMSKDSKM